MVMTRRSTVELTFREVSGTSKETTVAGGVVVDWIDKTAYACAASWTRTDCVTSYVGNMHFTKPIPRDVPVTVQARVVHTGNTSVHIQTRVLIQHPDEGWLVCTECFMIYVAIGEGSEPAPVQPYEPSSELERRRSVDAAQRRAYRRQVEQIISSMPEDMGTSERLALRFLAETEDRYPDGSIRGGAVMKWIDLAAEICAERYSGYDVAAVLTGGVRFYRPVTVGDLVEVEARLVLTGSKSMHVLVRVRSGARAEKESDVVAYGLPVMVAPDGEGAAHHITPWQPITDEDHAIAEKARQLRDLRNATLLAPSPLVGSG